ncbi:hypothetical protein MASR1M45_12310 [Candidatus Kapaibacterium sp.]
MSKVNRCKSCGAMIIWLRTKSGKSMPVEYFEISDNEVEFDINKHTSHFANCKYAQQHRRKSNE